MPNANDCIDRVKEAFGEAIGNDKAEQIVRDIEKLKESSTSTSEFKDKARALTEKLKEDITITRATIAEDTIKLSNNIEEFSSLVDEFNGDVVSAAKTFLTGSATTVKGAAASVEMNIRTNVDILAHKLDDILTKHGLDDVFGEMTEDMSKNIYAILHSMEKGGIISPAVEAKYDTTTVNMAKAIRQFLNVEYGMQKRSGAKVRYTEGYVPMFHDVSKISKAAKKQWIDDVLKVVDEKKTFGENAESMDQATKESFLGTIYDNIMDGEYTGGIGLDRLEAALSSTSTLGKRLARSRTLHFASGEGAFEYAAKYGRENLNDTLLGSIHSTARNSAVLEKFGSNPEASWVATQKEVLRMLKETKKDINLRKVKNELQNLNNTFKGLVYGEQQGVTSLYTAAQNIKAFNNVTLLGGASVTAFFGDIATAVSMLKINSNRGLFSSIKDTISETFKAMSPEYRTKAAKRLGHTMETMIGSTFDRIGGGVIKAGRMAKLQKTFFKWTGLSALTDSVRIAHQDILVKDFGDAAVLGKEFDDLGVLKTTLERASINKVDWDFLRKYGVSDFQGEKGILIDTLNNIASDDVNAHIAKHNITELGIAEEIITTEKGSTKKVRSVKDTQISAGKYIQQLKRKYRTMLLEAAEDASPQPRTPERQALKAGKGPDSPMSILVDLAAQYKSFAFTMGRVAKRVSVSDTGFSNFFNAVKNGDAAKMWEYKGGLMPMIQFAALLTTAGYMREAFFAVAKGQEPPDPTNINTIRRAMMSGGAAGLLGDIILADHSGYGTSLSDSVLGPTFSRVGDIKTIVDKFMKGDNTASLAMNFLIRSVPFNNLFYTKDVIEYLFINELRETLTPGYRQRVEKRLEEREGLLYSPEYYRDASIFE